jgi:hypothetical protein
MTKRAKKIAAKKAVAKITPMPPLDSGPGKLKASVRTAIVAEVTASVRQSINYLVAKQAELAAYGGFDEFIDKEGDDAKASKIGKGLSHHLIQCRAALATSLWRRQLFLSCDLIDRLLFDVACLDSGTPIETFFQLLKSHLVRASGFIVYPLHSFGILGLGFFDFFKGGRPDILIKPANLAVCAQTNDVGKSVEFLERTIREQGMNRSIDQSMIEHYVASRGLEWFSRNPLLIVSLTSITDGIYNNQFIYVLKLKMSTALLLMLNAVGKQCPEDERLIAGSTSRVNNWQTLDIHHYLVFQPKLNDPKTFETQCVPMHSARLELAELSDVSAEIDTRAWSSKRAAKRLGAIRAALEKVEAGYLEHWILGDREMLRARIYRKLVDSIDHFRRGYSAAANDGEKIVSLAIGPHEKAPHAGARDAQGRGRREALPK